MRLSPRYARFLIRVKTLRQVFLFKLLCASCTGLTLTECAPVLRLHSFHPIDTDLIDGLQQNAAAEQAAVGGETDAKPSKARGSAPASSPPPPPLDSTPSASNKSFLASTARKEKIKTGDFRLTVDVLPHPVFSRGSDGADLYTSVAISLDEALTGFTREIVTLDGSVVAVR